MKRKTIKRITTKARADGNYAVRSMRLLAAIVRHYEPEQEGQDDRDAPDHSHYNKGRWDKDGSKCQWCATWRQVRKLVAANPS